MVELVQAGRTPARRTPCSKGEETFTVSRLRAGSALVHCPPAANIFKNPLR